MTVEDTATALAAVSLCGRCDGAALDRMLKYVWYWFGFGIRLGFSRVACCLLSFFGLLFGLDFDFIWSELQFVFSILVVDLGLVSVLV
jgi:hypothetical protein